MMKLKLLSTAILCGPLCAALTPPSRPLAARSMTTSLAAGASGPQRQILLVAAGIGVTPFASILKTLARQAQTNRLETPLKRCSFFWICRDEREFQSFKDVLVDILAGTALANIFELNTCAAQLQSIRMIT